MHKRYFILVFIITSIVTAWKVEAQAQYTDVVCAGDMRVYKINTKPGSTYTWTVSGGNITHEYTDSIVVTWGNMAGDYAVQVVEISSFGCLGSPITAKVKISVPWIGFGDEIKICEGTSTVLDLGFNYPVHRWNTGDTTRSIEVKTPGFYSVEVIDAVGCRSSDTILLSIIPKPEVNLGRDTMLCGDESLLLDAGPLDINNDHEDIFTYEWSDNKTGQTNVITEKNIPYIAVQVSNGDGCVTSDTLIILACDYGKYPIPNTITPNGDGLNDTWKIWFLAYFPDALVQIYDRWGQLVHQARHVSPDKVWDGTSNGIKLPMDSYFYIIDFKKNGYIPRTGTISIIR